MVCNFISRYAGGYRVNCLEFCKIKVPHLSNVHQWPNRCLLSDYLFTSPLAYEPDKALKVAISELVTWLDVALCNVPNKQHFDRYADDTKLYRHEKLYIV